ncbi:hypothetical protein [Agromyces sp. ZXT2-3]|uniref:hypothetical protein n=1 Tax=Agromyces sp. ZXT2-3 TaxID=3461152 RepID=UPI0040551DF0
MIWRMTRNPYLIGLLSAAGFLLVLAFMLSLVIGQMTDYTAYDTAGVATLQGWIFVLIGSAGTAATGGAVLGGVAWSLRRGDAVADRAARVPSRGDSRGDSESMRASSPTARP